MIIRAGVPGEAAVLSRLARAAKAHWGYAAARLDRWRDDLGMSAEAIVRRPTFVAEIDGPRGAGGGWARSRRRSPASPRACGRRCDSPSPRAADDSGVP